MRKKSDSLIFNCLICKEDKPTLGMGQCEHRRVCLYCTMKSRLLYNDVKCPVCNAKLDSIFIVNFNDLLSYEELLKGKEYYYQDDDFEASGLYYTTIEAKEEALMLRGFNCPIRKCRSEAFENIQALNLHLNKVHKKYYCDCCLRDNKKFLAETEIYNQEQLKDHIEYGEYDNGTLVYPPHPLCPFCDLRFYNDEGLFKHMNETHFICQLCKDQKNIVFYSLLENLLSHYKDSHFCCPYKECLDDVYVVFAKEEELLTHLITKHKVTNATDKLTQLFLEGNKAKFGPKGLEKPTSNTNWSCGYVNKDQFNFSMYMADIKANSEKYMKDMEKQKKYTKAKKQEHNEGGYGDYYGNDDYYGNNSNKDYYYDDGYYDNNNQQGKRGGGGGGRGRGGRGGRGGKKRGRGGYNKYNDDYGYDNNKHYNNKYNNHNDNVYTEEIEVSNLNQFNNNPSPSSTPSTYESQSYQKPKHSKAPPQNTITQSKPRNIDYSFIFNLFLRYIKDFLKDKITQEKIPEAQLILAKETIYQLIIIIDKLDSFQKLFELTFIHTFGLDMEIAKELKACLSTCSNIEGENRQVMLHEILNQMSIRNILIFYKYIQTSAKKVDGLFYKLDPEQIDSDLYEDFVERPYDKEKQREADREMERNKKKNNNKGKNNQGSDYNKEKSSLNYIFGGNTNKESTEAKETKLTPDASDDKPKSKLAMLLDSSSANKGNKTNEVSGHKKVGGKQKDFKMSNFNMDRDFPAFK